MPNMKGTICLRIVSMVKVQIAYDNVCEKMADYLYDAIWFSHEKSIAEV